uniref:Uncharacterized protein n=1 Tax=Cacopsylla melanoneura TaxID=428564 RepID=A0A8D8VXA3_9HEMI
MGTILLLTATISALSLSLLGNGILPTMIGVLFLNLESCKVTRGFPVSASIIVFGVELGAIIGFAVAFNGFLGLATGLIMPKLGLEAFLTGSFLVLSVVDVILSMSIMGFIGRLDEVSNTDDAVELYLSAFCFVGFLL